MFRRIAAPAAVIGLFLLLSHPDSRAEDAALIKALGSAQMTLEDGLATSEMVGKPISAKFEIEDGRLQLSVYTVASDGYREIVIWTSTGVLMSAQKITDTDDLAAANVQSRAMQAATMPLRTAIEKAASQTSGSRSVSVVPVLVDGRPVAKVALLNAGALTIVNVDIR